MFRKNEKQHTYFPPLADLGTFEVQTVEELSTPSSTFQSFKKVSFKDIAKTKLPYMSMADLIDTKQIIEPSSKFDMTPTDPANRDTAVNDIFSQLKTEQ